MCIMLNSVASFFHILKNWQEGYGQYFYILNINEINIYIFIFNFLSNTQIDEDCTHLLKFKKYLIKFQWHALFLN